LIIINKEKEEKENNMMDRRIFTAINFSEKTKQELVDLQNKIDYLFPDNNPMKWTKRHNLHTTVFFIGYIQDNDLMNTINAVEKAVKDEERFKLNFNNVTFFPKDNESKKMIWVEGKESKTLSRISQKIKKETLSTEKETQKLIPHITLGRITAWQFKKLEDEEIPQLENELFDLNIEVNSIDVVESVLKKGGAEYTFLKKIMLK
jgi:2'-5' RNA ligase